MALKCPPGYELRGNLLTGEDECVPIEGYKAPSSLVDVVMEGSRQAEVAPKGPSVAPKRPSVAPKRPSVAPKRPSVAPKGSTTRDAYVELLGSPEPKAPFAPKTIVDLPKTVVEELMPKETSDKGTVTILENKDTGTVVFLDDSEETVYMGEMVRGEDGAEARYASRRLAPGTVLRSPTPPPCEEPPFDYSQPQSCAANSLAVIPDWTSQATPFLNGQTCQYNVPTQTPYECPGADELFSRVLEYVPQGVQSLMNFLGKQYDEEDEAILYGYIEESITPPYEGAISSSAFETQFTPNTNLKALYKWPFSLIRALNLQDLPTGLSGEEEITPQSFTLKADGLFLDIDKFGQQLNVYARDQVEAWGRQKIKVVLRGTPQEINLANEFRQIGKLKRSITNLLTFNDFQLSRNGSTTTGTQFEMAASVSVAEDIKLSHDGEFRLVDAFARERASAEQKLNLSILSEGTGLNNVTMLGYLSQLDNIIYDISKTTPISFTDFLSKYHYPDVSIIDGVEGRGPALGFEEGCIGADLIGAGNSILDELGQLDDLFAEKFSKFVCMTPAQIEQREEAVEKARANGELQKLVNNEFKKAIPLEDPFIRKIIEGVENISDSVDVVQAAWERLFDKMTMCGLFNLITKVIELIAKNDVCGITPEKALLKAISSALQKIDVQDIKRIFDGLPDEIRPLIQERYFEAVSEFIGDVGLTSGLTFPWDFEERQSNQSEQEERGLLLYSADLFAIPPETEYEGRLATAYLAGYQHEQFAYASEEEEVAYWNGYVQLSRDEASGPTVRSVDVEIGLTEEQSANLVNEVSVTLNRRSGASVGRLIGRLATDTLKYMIEALINAIMGTLQEFYSMQEILSLFEDVPVVGALIKMLPTVAECAINANLKKGEQPISFSELQNNLFKGLEIDICQLPPGKKPIALPNLELAMRGLDVNTLMSQFRDALVEVLKQVLLKILIKVLTTIIKKAIEVVIGFACAATQGDTDEFLRGALPSTVRGALQGNLSEMLNNALCPDNVDGSSESPEQQLARLFSSLSPGLSEGDALSLLGPSTPCNFVSRIQQRLTTIQLMDLMQGNSNPTVIATVLDIVNNDCPALSVALYDENSVESFFQNLGVVFPEGYFDQLRDALEDQIGPLEDVITTCDSDVEEALEDLREALNCEDETTPEQIDAYIEAFQDRLESTIEDLASLLANGLDGAMEDSIQNVLDDLVPKDGPAVMMIAEQVVSVLFDPLYATYARDLMMVLGGTGRPKEAGFMNMVLSNKFGVGQVGQMTNFHMAFMTLSGPLLGLINLLPPPASNVVSAEAMESLATNLRLTFFGPETDAEYDATVDDDDATVGPTTGGGAAFLTNPYGFGPLKKPTNVAPSLQEKLNNITTHVTVEGSVITIRIPSDVTLDYQLPFSSEAPGTSLFYIRYNFETGEFLFNPYASPTYEEPDLNNRLSFTALGNTTLQGELADFFEQLETIGASYTGDFSITPANIGAALLLKNMLDNRDEGAELLSSSESIYFENASNLLGRIRGPAIDSYAKSIAANEDAFSYGEYNLEVLTDSDIIGTDPTNPQPSEDLLEQGYSFVYLADGQIFVQPPAKGGWLEIKDALLPPINESFCCPDQVELFDINSIKDRTLKGYQITNDDPRISLNPKTVNEPPYARILSRMNLAACEGSIITTIRTYAIEYFLQGYAALNKFTPNIPGAYSDLLSEYIIQRMKREMLHQGPNPGAPVWPPGLIPTSDILDTAAPEPGPLSAQKMHGYWYEFLEQCVQTYSRRIKAGQVVVTGEVNAAMSNLQSVVDTYIQPTKEEVNAARIETLAAMAATGILAPYIPIVAAGFTLKNYKRKKKIEALQTSEEDAMVILRQFVSEELTRIGDVIEDVFAPPPGGRVENVYLDFLRNTFSLGERTILDMPVVDHSSSPPEVGSILRVYSEGDLLPDEIDDETIGLFSLNDNFVLESYIKMQRTEAGEESLPTIRDNEIYPIAYLQRIIDDEFTASDTSIPLGDLFSSVQYGLRLVLVPAPTTVAANLEIFNNMSEDSNTNSQGFFELTPLAGTIGKYSVPIVYSSEIQLDYDLSVVLQDFLDIDLSNANIDNNETFQWTELALRMTEREEFRTLFQYSSPINSILSLLGIYTMESFVNCIGGEGSDWKNQGGLIRPFKVWNKTVFPTLKRSLKKQFNTIYNSNDYTYMEPVVDREARLEAERLRIQSSMAPMFDRLTAPVAARIVEANPICYEEETNVVVSVDDTPGRGMEDRDTGDDDGIDESEGTIVEYVCCEERVPIAFAGAPGTSGENIYMIRQVRRTREQCEELSEEYPAEYSVGGIYMSAFGCEDIRFETESGEVPDNIVCCRWYEYDPTLMDVVTRVEFTTREVCAERAESTEEDPSECED